MGEAAFPENISAWVEALNAVVNGFLWGPAGLALFLLVGLYFTLKTGFFQLRQARLWLGSTLLALFRNKDVIKSRDRHAISRFQSLCTALAATLGTGNIAGVATAIASGGPGAVFWMWMAAFLGMMTAFAENALGIKYRYRDESGAWVGGAMITIERGLGLKWLAALFAAFCALASFGMGNMAQANSIASGLEQAFGLPSFATALLVMTAAGLTIIGGIRRIAGVAERFVPFMAILYVLGGLAVIALNITSLPSALALIFREAFRLEAAAGGAAGYGIARAMRFGIARGVFSNEAGLGSSVAVHAASDVEEPVEQGMWAIFEVFADTLVMCTITALAILCSGVYDRSAYAGAADGTAAPTGATLTIQAFSSVLPGFGGPFISISILLFAFSTILGWSYSGERAVVYLFGKKAVLPYKLLFIAAIYLGCSSPLQLVWDVSDTFNGLMALPNLIGVSLLGGEVLQMTRDYLRRGGKRRAPRRKTAFFG
ncbi:MAG: sodium:alanine symporter family protein [Christensenellaceae bacterium]|jgi:AGCS family alanine or glycine:cation symporter|nr:sodium:alanine symporter family protein [Christensenellaceae bacterium]